MSRAAGGASARPSRPASGRLLARRLHGYVGMVIAPTVIFFAATGSLQLFDLHQAHGDYRPPSVVVALASLHKDQTLFRKPHPVARRREGRAGGAGSSHPLNLATRLLKVFCLIVALGLLVSTALGLWMGLSDRRNRRVNLVLLLVGLAIPILLALI